MSESKSKKQIILEAAAQLFREKGYSATSMRDLAQAVQLRASSLYNHISSKEEILKLICFDNAQRFFEGLERVEQLSASLTDKVEALIRAHIRIAMEDVTSVTAFNDEWRHLSEPFLGQFIQMRKNYEQRFKAIVEAGITQGAIKPMHTQVVLYTIFSSVRWLYDGYKPGGDLSPEKLENEIVALLMNGLATKEGINNMP